MTSALEGGPVIGSFDVKSADELKAPPGAQVLAEINGQTVIASRQFGQGD